LEDIASKFEGGAPPRVDTPLKAAAEAPQLPELVGHSDTDNPHQVPERSSLRGDVLLEGKSLSDVRAVVTLEPVGGGYRRPPPQQRVMEQRSQEFFPHLMVVPAGSTVAFPNRDPVYHNVFSRSEIMPFDLGLYGAGFSREMTFAKPGVYRLGCNIHAKMSAYVVVVSQPHYSVVQGGTFNFASLKPGQYTLRAWSERTLEPFTQEVELKPGPNSLKVSLAADAPRDNPDKFGMPR
jgi:plastocyanin